MIALDCLNCKGKIGLKWVDKKRYCENCGVELNADNVGVLI